MGRETFAYIGVEPAASWQLAEGGGMGELLLLVLPLGGPRASSPRAAGRGNVPLATGG